jgi:hypothetical protein
MAPTACSPRWRSSEGGAASMVQRATPRVGAAPGPAREEKKAVVRLVDGDR